MKKTVRTFQELEQFIEAFAKQDSNQRLLVLVGSPGLSKSTAVGNALGFSARFISGDPSAFQVYRELWNFRDFVFVFDDVDLYADPSLVRLMKQVSDTRTEHRMVYWPKASTQLRSEGIPTEFATASRVIIIANDWKGLNKNVDALDDRGIVVHVAITPQSIHERIGQEKWFTDEEVYQFIGDNLGLVKTLSMRQYVQASNLRKDGLDYKSALLETWGVDADTIITYELLVDPKYDKMEKPEEERAKAFERLTGKKRRSFFYAKKGLPKTLTLSTAPDVVQLEQARTIILNESEQPIRR